MAATVNPAGIFCQTVAMEVVECKLGGDTAGLVTYWLEKSWFCRIFPNGVTTGTCQQGPGPALPAWQSAACPRLLAL